MASLRMKVFEVQVFSSPSLLDGEPDVYREVVALTELTAIQSVMQRAMIAVAGVVHVVCEDQERWLYEVRLVESELQYERVM